MTVIHIILMAPYIQTNNEELYLYNNDVTYYVITCTSAFYLVSAAQQWYVQITFDVTHNNGTQLSVGTGDPPKYTARSWLYKQVVSIPV